MLLRSCPYCNYKALLRAGTLLQKFALSLKSLRYMDDSDFSTTSTQLIICMSEKIAYNLGGSEVVEIHLISHTYGKLWG